MGSKYLITNTSDAPRFVAEIGKLLQAGQSAPAHRLDPPTLNDPAFNIKLGDFFAPSSEARIVSEKQRYDDEEEEGDVPVAKKVGESVGPARLIEARSQSRSAPLEAVGSLVPNRDEGDEEGALAKDELDEEVARAEKPDESKGEGVGFVTRRGGNDPLVGR